VFNFLKIVFVFSRFILPSSLYYLGSNQPTIVSYRALPSFNKYTNLEVVEGKRKN